MAVAASSPHLCSVHFKHRIEGLQPVLWCTASSSALCPVTYQFPCTRGVPTFYILMLCRMSGPSYRDTLQMQGQAYLSLMSVKMLPSVTRGTMPGSLPLAARA